MIQVKICGITREEDLKLTIDEGAVAIGFVTFEKSPRFVSVERVKELCQLIPTDIKRVAVTVDDSLEQLEAYLEAGINVIQLHGSADYHTVDFASQLKRAEVWRAIRLKEEAEIEQYKDFPCSAFVIDSFVKNATIPGGTGHLANWNLSKRFVEATSTPVYLAGGISAENILEAEEQVKPAAYDLSSSVEISPGIKSANKIKTLFKVANNA